jgi:lipopolysaccharide export system permease protein
MKLLDRYILSELAAPFAFGVAAFTGILTASAVLFHLVTEMVRYGLPAALVMQILLLRIPEMVFYTFPMSMLLASLMAFGRMANDFEIVALKAVGVSLYRMMLPLLIMATLVSMATILLDEYIVPAAAWRAKSLLYEATHKQQLPQSRDHVAYNEMRDDALVRAFYARNFDGQAMHDVVVQEFADNHLIRLIQAKLAVPVPDGWRFEQGTLYQVDGVGDFRYVAHFATQKVVLGAALLDLSRENRLASEMNANELAAHIRRLEATGAQGREINELRVLWQQKFSVPFACFVFALVGAPMGLSPQRGSGALGLGLSVLVIFVYYILMFVSMAMGQTGTLPPIVAAWLPNGVAASLGAIQLRRLARY